MPKGEGGVGGDTGARRAEAHSLTHSRPANPSGLCHLHVSQHLTHEHASPAGVTHMSLEQDMAPGTPIPDASMGSCERDWLLEPQS